LNGKMDIGRVTRFRSCGMLVRARFAMTSGGSRGGNRVRLPSWRRGRCRCSRRRPKRCRWSRWGSTRCVSRGMIITIWGFIRGLICGRFVRAGSAELVQHVKIAGANSVVPPESVSQLFFRPFGAESVSTNYPRLAPWALILRRFAAIPRLLSHFRTRALVSAESPPDLNRSSTPSQR